MDNGCDRKIFNGTTKKTQSGIDKKILRVILAESVKKPRGQSTFPLCVFSFYGPSNMRLDGKERIQTVVFDNATQCKTMQNSNQEIFFQSRKNKRLRATA